jgi:hypothetical protein
MSSHWAWAERVTAEHDQNKPFAPENGQPLRFAIGDHVIFTNDYGVEFEMQITGFFERPEAPCGLYARGSRYLVNSSSPWFPVKESSLRLNTAKQPAH